jgi:hypothetical protein
VGERMERFGNDEDTLVAAVIGKGSRKGSTFFGRAGDVIRRPPMWAVIAAGLSATGERGRRAALRGSVCYLSAAAAHLPIKAVVGRRHPPRLRRPSARPLHLLVSVRPCGQRPGVRLRGGPGIAGRVRAALGLHVGRALVARPKARPLPE